MLAMFFSMTAFANYLPEIAVYAAGDINEPELEPESVPAAYAPKPFIVDHAPAAAAVSAPGYVSPAAQIDDEQAERTEIKRPPRSFGVSFGTGGSEIHFRQGLSANSRLYYGFGWWSGPLPSRIEGVFDRDRGTEVHLGSFMEWHTNGMLSFYGGPGIMLGLYNYDYAYYKYYDRSYGLVFGVQGGVELRLGWFLIGVETRLALYVRSNGEGGHAAIGVRTGILF